MTEEERARLDEARYEGSPLHKRNPGDFGLSPPASPRPEKTLCDEAAVFSKAKAEELFAEAVRRGLVSEPTTNTGYPKEIWVVAEDGQVFEGMYGGSRTGCYHGYPIRRSDPLFDEVTRAWNQL